MVNCAKIEGLLSHNWCCSLSRDYRFRRAKSKWNKIEHRMFCHITQNWRGKALVSHEVMVALIASTTTQKGLKIKAERNQGRYEKGKTPTEEELASIRMFPQDFHGEWNYAIRPQPS